ncbi:transcriptional regulator FnrL [Paracoccus sp. (in: a-proteobacteria)]|uniref:transcriptional regulator FnrL n=1 Tax=Paracoccus sp. TaxID=267 RepID=UPI0026DF17FD|nr:Crp/Fnr family transcriptional regulator [Paracoccus sp. (in: a-proteobacteria)]MDO5647555.1 Crp/Fnr family transcriptional regulator [Paracoccus sp. (in: a-proteobacteria)]
MRCGECPIRYRAVCAQCDADELTLLEGIKFYRTYEAGQPIVWEGDQMDFVASVVTGVASLTHTLEDGRTQMVGLLLPSDFLGRPGRERAAYHATAATKVVLCCFRRKAFDDMMRRTPRIAHRLLEMTLDELDAAREWMLLLGRKTAREKIASFIAIIARREAALNKRRPGGRMEIDLPLTREAMADYLGVTLETVSRQVSALKRDGVIELRGKRGVILPDFARLVDESGDDSDGGWIA